MVEILWYWMISVTVVMVIFAVSLLLSRRVRDAFGNPTPGSWPYWAQLAVGVYVLVWALMRSLVNGGVFNLVFAAWFALVLLLYLAEPILWLTVRKSIWLSLNNAARRFRDRKRRPARNDGDA